MTEPTSPSDKNSRLMQGLRVELAPWIPVSERKPESSLPAVMAIHMEGPYQTYWLAFYFKDRDRWEHAYKEHPKHLTNVTHWMPLPAAPSERQQL